MKLPNNPTPPKPLLYGPDDKPLETKSVGENEATPDTQREPNGQATQANPDIAVTHGVPTPPPAETSYKITCEPKKSFWDNVKTGAEILGILLLGVYTLYTIKMYCANKQAADAATKAANAAGESVRLAREIAIREQRAWVSHKKIQLVSVSPGMPDVGQRIMVVVALVNTGKTPALDQWTRGAVSLSADPVPETQFPVPNPMGTGLTIVPVGDVNFGIQFTTAKPVTASDLARYLSENVAHHDTPTFTIWIHAIIHYRDVFGCKHFTEICGFHRPLEAPDAWSWYNKYNGIDKNTECAKE